MFLLKLIGSDIYSEFRKANFLNYYTKLKNIEAKYLFYIASNSKELNLDLINKLLNSKKYFEAEFSFIIAPRIGSKSPWASKAMDIFKNCGVENVEKLERLKIYKIYDHNNKLLNLDECQSFIDCIYDRMTESFFTNIDNYFLEAKPKELNYINILDFGINALKSANINMGLALNEEEISYLFLEFSKIKRNPSDAELLMFAQVNSEHCRHKIFNAEWFIDGEKQEKSLFQMIKNTHEKNPSKTLLAYSDNSSVIEGFLENHFEPSDNNKYSFQKQEIDTLMKVETHNHPTAISPHAGASTGIGGEIRDEAATGIGSKSKAGLCGFVTSNLNIPDFKMPWEVLKTEHPKRLATPLQIMLEGPIGGASFSNEFGRPGLCGFFKTYEELHNNNLLNFHKPIMLAGGMGYIKRKNIFKKELLAGQFVLQIGGPALKIGIGGGAASSMLTGSNDEDLDFNSVQRENPEMQRRCQQVIDSCVAMNENPIISIHDVGAGGLSNACPELVESVGAKLFLRNINNEDISMSPMEIWCNEAQERFVLIVKKENFEIFKNICLRENCPFALLGETTGDHHFQIYDDHFKNNTIDIDLNIILKKPPRLLKNVLNEKNKFIVFDFNNIDLNEAVDRVLKLPSVANKNFLVTIADRSITGMVSRDQMVGPYQIPISNCAVTISSYTDYTGEAMSLGEKVNLAVIDSKRSGRMAVAEAILNLSSSYFGNIENIKLSANWMCACSSNKDNLELFETVKELGEKLCPKLGISIPVGKDSLSMKTTWTDSLGNTKTGSSPLSVIISSFVKVMDLRKTLTPNFKKIDSEIYILNFGKSRMGGSALSQVFNQTGSITPDLDNEVDFINLVNCIQELLKNDKILSMHDRSDGGLFTSLLEMSISSRIGAEIEISKLSLNVIEALFNEELGLILELDSNNIVAVKETIAKYKLSDFFLKLGRTTKTKEINIYNENKKVFSKNIFSLLEKYNALSFKIQSLRDNPSCANEEFLINEKDPGINIKLNFDINELEDFRKNIFNIKGKKPKIAILREQGVNGQVEMAAAFTLAGFHAYDVHTNDLMNGVFNLNEFQGMAVCGGFSYGDVLGAGYGWANKILANEKLFQMFSKFFKDENTFTLGACNGCQMLSNLKQIIPGTNNWPKFIKNKSEQFEARYVSVEILKSKSVLFKNMVGSIMPIPVAHGEGFSHYKSDTDIDVIKQNNEAVLRYVDNIHNASELYPFNPNGSKEGINAYCNSDGRVTIMMPHPERLFRAVQMSYNDGAFKGETGPWYKIFKNAYDYCN